MARHRGDVLFYPHDARTRPIASSTKASSDLLAALAQDNPSASIGQIRDLIHFDREAVAVCDAYISIGEGELVPRWS